MRRFVFLFSMVVPALLLAGSVKAEDPVVGPDVLGERYTFFKVLDEVDGKVTRYLYADAQQHVHVYAVNDGKAQIEWETTNLGSRVSAIVVKDLDKDGDLELVIATKGGRILVYDTKKYDLIWENLQDPFPRIMCLTISDIDQDPQQEIIFIAGAVDGTYLNIYDGLNFTREWQSERQYSAEQILVHNMDDDPQMEIILNTGLVLDSRFYTVELTAPRFGDRISLWDMNGDGIPEVIGNNPDFSLRIYDVYAEREEW